MFSSPELKAELSAAVRKRKRESQLTTFNKLQLMAADKLVQLDEFINLEVGVRYELFAEKVKGIKFSRLLRQGQGPSAQAPTVEALSAPRLPQSKPNESFLDSRMEAMPWYTVASTSVSGEDA